MQRIVFKFGIGAVVLLASFAFWWTAEGPSARATDLSTSDIEWASFPVVRTGDVAGRQQARHTGSARVLFVYSPHQCYSNRDAMDSWHQAARQTEGVTAANVLLERGRQSAQRYLSVFPTPYQTRLDSTGWFRKTLNPITTPAVVLLSDEGTRDIFYPTASSLSDRQRQQHVHQLVDQSDS
jgi:hypothetical protein